MAGPVRQPSGQVMGRAGVFAGRGRQALGAGALVLVVVLTMAGAFTVFTASARLRLITCAAAHSRLGKKWNESWAWI